MTINPAWTNADTVALKSKALDLARQARNLKAQLDDLYVIMNDNEILFGDLNDEDESTPPNLIGPVPKQAIWDALGFDAQLGLLWTNQQLNSLGYWGGVLGRIVKV